MSLAAAVFPQTSLREIIDESMKSEVIDAALFIGRKVRIDGGNYRLETTISNVLISTCVPDNKSHPAIKNLRFKLKESVVSVDKGRYQSTRTIDHVSYAPGFGSTGYNYSDQKVVFKPDGKETIKEALIEFLD